MCFSVTSSNTLRQDSLLSALQDPTIQNDLEQSLANCCNATVESVEADAVETGTKGSDGLKYWIYLTIALVIFVLLSFSILLCHYMITRKPGPR